MRFLFLFCLFFWPITAQADETQIVTDQDKNTITYGGNLTDSGSAHVEKMINTGGEDAE